MDGWFDVNVFVASILYLQRSFVQRRLYLLLVMYYLGYLGEGFELNLKHPFSFLLFAFSFVLILQNRKMIWTLFVFTRDEKPNFNPVANQNQVKLKCAPIRSVSRKFVDVTTSDGLRRAYFNQVKKREGITHVWRESWSWSCTWNGTASGVKDCLIRELFSDQFTDSRYIMKQRRMMILKSRKIPNGILAKQPIRQFKLSVLSKEKIYQ